MAISLGVMKSPGHEVSAPRSNEETRRKKEKHMHAKNKPDAKDLALPIIPLPASGAVTELGDEGYELEITPDGEACVRADTAAGRFYGGQTLLQLQAAGPLQAGRIVDRPRFRWRGLMLDVARHFRSVSFIKRRRT
jgi:N-acetyl-beta-hexosaminidase